VWILLRELLGTLVNEAKPLSALVMQSELQRMEKLIKDTIDADLAGDRRPWETLHIRIREDLATLVAKVRETKDSVEDARQNGHIDGMKQAFDLVRDLLNGKDEISGVHQSVDGLFQPIRTEIHRLRAENVAHACP